MGNESGITPIEYQVLVKPKKVMEKTEGGIYIPEGVRNQEQGAVIEGELVAIGGMAFDRHTKTPWPERKAGVLEEGQTVVFSKFGGKTILGDDEETYRLMNDRDIIAIRS